MRSVTVGLAALAMSGVATLATASPAFADPCPAGTYPPSDNCISVTLPGQDFTQYVPPVGTPVGTIIFFFKIGGFEPFAQVVVQLHSDVINLGTFTADKDGFVSGTAQIAPDQIPASFDFGHHTLTMAGTLADGTFGVLSAPITIRKSLTHRTSSGGSTSGSTGGSTVGVTGGVTAPQPAKAPGTNVPGTTAGGVHAPKVFDTKDSSSNTSTAILALVGAAILGGGLILVVARRRGGVTPTSTL